MNTTKEYDMTRHAICSRTGFPATEINAESRLRGGSTHKPIHQPTREMAVSVPANDMTN
jgi:hypothetical protein